MLPNVLRIVPSNAIRFTIFDYLKTYFDEYKKNNQNCNKYINLNI